MIREEEKKPFNIDNMWMTISMSIFFVTLYTMITTFSIHGMVGFLILNFFFAFLYEKCIFSLSGFRLGHKQGCIMLVLALVILFARIVFDIDKIIILAVFIALILLIVVWAVLEYVKTKKARIVTLIIIFGLFIACLYILQNAGSFSPDSYSYYEISQTIGKDYGRVGTIRQYIVKSDYNCSFPYFYPLCVFIVDKITALGRYSGVLLNIYIMLATALLLLKVSKNLTKSLFCGGMGAFFLFTVRHYLGEVCAARAIPLSILLSLGSFYLLAVSYISQKNKNSTFLIIGILNGLLISTRFDGAAMLLYCGLILLLFGENRIRHFLFYVVGSLLAMCPWIVYSAIRFGVPWMSDNNGTVFLVRTSYPSRIVMPNDGTLTLFNSPMEWFHALFDKASLVIYNVKNCSIVADVSILVCVVMLIIAICKKSIKPKRFIPICILLMFYIGKTLMFILVGYPERRYHVETVVFVAFFLLVFCQKCKLKIVKKKIISCLVGLELLLTISSFGGIHFFTAFGNGAESVLNKVEVAPEWVVSLDNKLTELVNQEKDEILMLRSDCYVFGGWTDWKVYAAPRTMEVTKIAYAMNTFMDVEYVIVSAEYDDEILNYLRDTCIEIPLDNDILFEVRK